MGRELKRVALNFNHPLNKVWEGFLNPWYKFNHDCGDCEGGYSKYGKYLNDLWYGNAYFEPETPFTVDDIKDIITRKIKWSIELGKQRNQPDYYTKGGKIPFDVAVNKECHRMLDIYNWQWCHHLNQDDVNALLAENRLSDLTRDGHIPTPREVNLWSLEGMGHDCTNQHICATARAKREGKEDELYCKTCAGHGSVWESKEYEKKADEWEQEEPPTGEGYQIWETVSEGSPVSPVFAKPEDLADWMVDNDTTVTKGTSKEQWLKFINGPGWAPSLVMDGNGIRSGVEVGL